jgi:hypothetical protein
VWREVRWGRGIHSCLYNNGHRRICCHCEASTWLSGLGPLDSPGEGGGLSETSSSCWFVYSSSLAGLCHRSTACVHGVRVHVSRPRAARSPPHLLYTARCVLREVGKTSKRNERSCSGYLPAYTRHSNLPTLQYECGAACSAPPPQPQYHPSLSASHYSNTRKSFPLHHQ